MIFLKRYSGFVLLLLLSVLSILPFFNPGFFLMHDDTQVVRVFEMGKALKDGMFPVRWVLDLGYGYGYPIFNFYSPFPYYLGGFLNLAGLDPLLATKIVFILGILLAGVFMYILIKNILDETAALVSALIYMYFPYHAVNIYVRGDLGEVFAYAFLPIVFLGFYNIYNNLNKGSNFSENLKWILISGFSIALFIISHNLTSFMLLMTLALFTLITFFFVKEKKKIILFYFLIMFLGFLLSAFYSIPAIFEMKYTNVFSQIGGGADYSNHFVCLPQLWDSLWGYGGSTGGCIDGMSFKLGKLNIILAFLSLILFFYISIKNKFKENIFLYFSAFSLFIFSVFMTLDLSKIIWQTIPAMAFIQYPWRFLNFSGFFLSVIIGLLIVELKYLSNQKITIVFTVVIICFTSFYNSKLFQPKTYYLNDSSYYTNDSYIKWTVSKISDEYMPPNFKKPQNQNEIPNQKVETNSQNGEISDVLVKTNIISAKLILNRNTDIKVNLAYFPGWKVFDNGEKIKFKTEKSYLLISLPKGEHLLQVAFKQTTVEKVANILSLAGFAVLITGIIYLRQNRYHSKNEKRER